MPGTTVCFPQSVLAGLARSTEERGMSRNRLIVESCRRVVEIDDLELVDWSEPNHS